MSSIFKPIDINYNENEILLNNYNNTNNNINYNNDDINNNNKNDTNNNDDDDDDFITKININKKSNKENNNIKYDNELKINNIEINNNVDNEICSINSNNKNNKKIDENNNKYKKIFFIAKKRGRKKTLNKRNNHSKLDIDNLNNTIKISFLNFIIDYINSVIYEQSNHQTVKFRYLDGKIAIFKNKKFFKYFLRQNLKDILKIIPISQKYKNFNLKNNNLILNKNRILSILKYELEKPIYEFYKIFIGEEKTIKNNKIKYLNDIIKKKKENYKGKNCEQFINYLKYAANNFLNYFEVLDYSIDYFEDAGELNFENNNIETNNTENNTLNYYYYQNYSSEDY